MQGDGAPHRKQGEVKSQGSLEVGWRGGGGVGGGVQRGSGSQVSSACRVPAPAPAGIWKGSVAECHRELGIIEAGRRCKTETLSPDPGYSAPTGQHPGSGSPAHI